VLAALAGTEGVFVQAVPGADVHGRVLGHFDVLIAENLSGPLPGAPLSWLNDLRRFVERGGGMLLTHFSVGGGVFGPKPFPEVAWQEGKVGSKTVVALREHPLVFNAKVGQACQHMYWDHVTLHLGPVGEAVYGDEQGNTVVAAGQVGKGRVVCAGMVFGYDGPPDTPAKPSGWSLQFLQQAIRWLSGK
jgi:hypothetical protein